MTWKDWRDFGYMVLAVVVFGFLMFHFLNTLPDRRVSECASTLKLSTTK